MKSSCRRFWKGAEVRGRLLDGDGANVGGAEVVAISITSRNKRVTDRVETDPQGWFEFVASPFESTSVTINTPRSVPLEFDSLEELPSTPGWPELHLPRTGSLTGRLLSGQSAPGGQ